MTLNALIAIAKNDHPFHTGDRVQSKAFGIGKVVALAGVANVYVQFAGGEPRLMRASYLTATGGTRVNLTPVLQQPTDLMSAAGNTNIAAPEATERLAQDHYPAFTNNNYIGSAPRVSTRVSAY